MYLVQSRALQPLLSGAGHLVAVHALTSTYRALSLALAGLGIFYLGQRHSLLAGLFLNVVLCQHRFAKRNMHAGVSAGAGRPDTVEIAAQPCNMVCAFIQGIDVVGEGEQQLNYFNSSGGVALLSSICALLDATLSCPWLTLGVENEPGTASHLVRRVPASSRVQFSLGCLYTHWRSRGKVAPSHRCSSGHDAGQVLQHRPPLRAQLCLPQSELQLLAWFGDPM
jgi:hypothetical protein